MKKLVQIGLRMIVLVALVGCSNGEFLGMPVGDGPMTGTWTGTVEDSAYGTGQLVLTTSQTTCGYAGVYCGWATRFERATYSLDFEDASFSGTASGDWSSGPMILTLHNICEETTQRFTTTGTTNQRSVIETRYDNLDCLEKGPSSGRIALRK